MRLFPAVWLPAQTQLSITVEVVRRNYSIPPQQRQLEMDQIAYEAFTCNASIAAIAGNAVSAIFWMILLVPATVSLVQERKRRKEEEMKETEPTPMSAMPILRAQDPTGPTSPEGLRWSPNGTGTSAYL